MTAQRAEMIDVHEWDAEESQVNRDGKRKEMIEMILKSVKANNGNKAYVKGMLRAGATDTKKYRCAAAYIWYSIKQDPKTGESPYTDLAKLLDRAPAWAH